jgi:hypothetical protein
MALSRPVMGLLYLYLNMKKVSVTAVIHNNISSMHESGLFSIDMITINGRQHTGVQVAL